MPRCAVALYVGPEADAARQEARATTQDPAKLICCSEPMPQYGRRLPHEHPAGRALFLTWHLHGSLPHARYPPPGKMHSGQAFVWMDRYLDTTRTGPLYLRQPGIAEAGVETLHYYDLHAYVIMPNHVHLLVSPHVAPPKLLKSAKNFSARRANEILGRKGNPFWQSESYDRWVRDGKEFQRIQTYIEQNPVKAGLAKHAEDYPWSSAASEVARASWRAASASGPT